MMIRFRDTLGPCLTPGGSVVTIGAFDGMVTAPSARWSVKRPLARPTPAPENITHSRKNIE